MNNVSSIKKDYFGYIDDVSEGEIVGWVYSSKNLLNRITVELISQDGSRFRCVAELDRPDVRAEGFGDGRYGFHLLVDPSLKYYPYLYVGHGREPDLEDLVVWKKLSDKQVLELGRSVDAVSVRNLLSDPAFVPDSKQSGVLDKYKIDDRCIYYSRSKYSEDKKNTKFQVFNGSPVFNILGDKGWSRLYLKYIDHKTDSNLKIDIKLKIDGDKHQVDKIGLAEISGDGKFEEKIILSKRTVAKNGYVNFSSRLNGNEIGDADFLFLEFSSLVRVLVDDFQITDLGLQKKYNKTAPDSRLTADTTILERVVALNSRVPQPGTVEMIAWLISYSECLVRMECFDRAASICAKIYELRNRLSTSQMNRFVACYIKCLRATNKHIEAKVIQKLFSLSQEVPEDLLDLERRMVSEKIGHGINRPNSLASIASSGTVEELASSLGARIPLGVDDCFAVATFYSRRYKIRTKERVPDARGAIDIQDQYKSWINEALGRAEQSAVQNLELGHKNILDTLRFGKPERRARGPKVSVIVSAFKAASTIDYAVRSLVNQTYYDLEIMVCDDESDDATLSKIKLWADRDHRIKVFSSLKNQGPYNIRNALLQHATGRYITFHDADDFAHPMRIEKQLVQMLKRGREISTVNWFRMRPTGEVVFFSDGKGVRMAVNSLMFRRELVDQIGQFWPSLCAADTDYYERLKQQFGYQVIGINAPLIFGLWSESSLTMTSGIEASEDGYRAESRRNFSEIAAFRRVLGPDLVDDSRVLGVLKDNNLLRKYHGVQKWH